MTKSQLITSAIFACLSNSIGSFFISTKSIVKTPTEEIIKSTPEVVSKVVETAEKTEKTGGWSAWASSWFSSSSKDTTQDKTAKASGVTGWLKATLVTPVTNAVMSASNNLGQNVNYVEQLQVFGKSFGLCTLFSTLPAVVTTYFDQKYLLTQELPNSGLLKYSVAGVSSAAISGLLTNFAPQIVSSTGLTFDPLSFYNQMIFASLSGIQACGFKAIQEWEEKSEKQQIVIIYNNSELGDASLKDFINSLDN